MYLSKYIYILFHLIFYSQSHFDSKHAIWKKKLDFRSWNYRWIIIKISTKSLKKKCENSRSNNLSEFYLGNIFWSRTKQASIQLKINKCVHLFIVTIVLIANDVIPRVNFQLHTSISVLLLLVVFHLFILGFYYSELCIFGVHGAEYAVAEALSQSAKEAGDVQCIRNLWEAEDSRGRAGKFGLRSQTGRARFQGAGRYA